jgi:hypothetical protein
MWNEVPLVSRTCRSDFQKSPIPINSNWLDQYVAKQSCLLYKIPTRSTARLCFHGAVQDMLGEDIGDQNRSNELNSPGGIIVGTLNICTFAAQSCATRIMNAFYGNRNQITSRKHPCQGSLGACLWISALQVWWLATGSFSARLRVEGFLHRDCLHPLAWEQHFRTFLTGKKSSAGRIFYLLDRQSAIDSKSTEGNKL